MTSLDLSDSAGDLDLIDKSTKDWIDMMNIKKEKLNTITSAGQGVQDREEDGYDIYFPNDNKHPITAFMNTNLGTVNGYDKVTTEYLIETFGMKGEIAASLRKKIKYHN